MLKSRGFTLIELLIVVAIIAILAAIAVPNFLEAQVRSKVARVRADVRTLATALESYHVDNGKYPPGEMQVPAYWGMTNPSFLSGISAVDWRWSFWTSPVAYMTSIPHDPFAVTGKLNAAKTGPFTISMEKRYVYVADATTLVGGSPAPNAMSNANFGTHGYMSRAGVTWLIYSWGPSRKRLPGDGKGADAIKIASHVPSDAGQWNYPDGLYDATNGTASWGMLMRTNKGTE